MLGIRKFSPSLGTPDLTRQLGRIADSVLRHHGLTLHRGQLQAGRAMTGRNIAEMGTGEGKTAAALLPIAYAAASGQTVFVATANDYLAKRDAEFAAPVLRDFHCTIGCLQASSGFEERRRAYQSQVIYGTIREFVFDFLRDRMTAATSVSALPRSGLANGRTVIQPAADTLIIDEADSILVDDAATPCVVSALTNTCDKPVVSCLAWGASVSSQLVEEVDYVELPTGEVVTTPTGRAKISRFPFPAELSSLTLGEIFHWLELSIQAHRRFRNGVDYVVRDGQVLIVDESTGRVSEGRQWSQGVHQAIEAREGVAVSTANEPRALLTIQDYVQRFPYVSGMTGTATEVTREFRSVYGLRVECITPHRPSRRLLLPEVVSLSKEEKLTRIVSEVVEMQRVGRPVLIGTRTVLSSHELSERLAGANIDHVVLNALNPEQESPIVAEAGQPGRVTVATNMAGRGTDIRLQNDVSAKGGLHVIGSELHSASRIDRQLMGRCGRQGDPGSFRQFMSLEDDNLIEAWGEEFVDRLQSRCRTERSARRRIVAAQRRLEDLSANRRVQLCRQQEQRVELLQSLGLDPILHPVVENS